MSHVSVLRLPAIALAVVIVAACSGGSSPDGVVAPAPSDALARKSGAASSGTATPAGASVDSSSATSTQQAVTADASGNVAFDVTAVAGFETGLRRVAHIDEQLAVVGRGGVTINWSGNPVLESGDIPGLLYGCTGLDSRRNCDVYGSVTYNQPGVYPFTVTYDPSGVFDRPVTLTGNVVVVAPSDFVIVSVGDSVASGEGNPVRALDLYSGDGGYWNDYLSNACTVGVGGGTRNCSVLGPDEYQVDSRCHRSGYAGPVVAGRRLGENPKNAFTFIHIACSGAVFGNEEPGDKASTWYDLGEISKIDLQLDWVRERVDKIDVLLISGGANNVGFGATVTRCLSPIGGSCASDNDLSDDLDAKFKALPGKYAAFERKIFPVDADNNRIDREGDPGLVAITEYYDPTRDADGNFPDDVTSTACGLDLVTRVEWEFLYERMVQPLNWAVADAATDNGWLLIDGIEDAFKQHGYCASATPGDHSGAAWVVKGPESVIIQGDVKGSAHPDHNGQEVYAEKIYNALVLNNPPRTQASATTAGQPYVFGTWVNTDVTVTLTAENAIDEAGIDSTYFAVNDPLCVPDSIAAGACTQYSSPIVVSESGMNVVSFLSLNANLKPETNSLPVEVWIDKEGPVMTCDADPAEIWPPDKRMVDVTVSVTAVDAVSGPADWWLDSVTDSYGEPGDSIVGFDVGGPDVDGQVLADRRGNPGARHYMLTYASEDHLGNRSTCDAVVTVPHDQRP